MLKLGKKPLPMIGKLSELLVSGNRAGFFEVGTSPRGPLDLKMQLSTSPRGLKNHDLGGGVGLGIVAALEKSSHNRREILAKYAVGSNSPSRSDPIPVSSGQKGEGFQKGIPDNFEEEDSEENYTFVTCHGRNKSVTKVYYDGGESTAKTKVQASIFETCNDNPNTSYVYPTSDFLSSCHLCCKDLHGKDIYMYRGDKAFCSTECRSTQMANDERKEREQCRSEAKRRSADVSSSSYSRDQIFFSAGILAV